MSKELTGKEVVGLVHRAALMGQERLERRVTKTYVDELKLETDISTLECEYPFAIEDRETAGHLLGEFGGNIMQTIHFLRWISGSVEEIGYLLDAGYNLPDLAWVYRASVGQDCISCGVGIQDHYRDKPSDASHYNEHQVSMAERRAER